MKPTHLRLLTIAGLIVLGLIAGGQLSDAFSARRRLELDRSDLSEIQSKLRDIQTLSDRPAVAALQVESASEIIDRIENAVRAAGLTPSIVANQTPGEPQRIGRTDYVLRKTEIELNAATVSDIVRFCRALRDNRGGSVVRDLRLFEPRNAAGRETWRSELVLTQVIFSPKSEV